MKIKSIANICKQQKRIYLYDDNGTQWVGDGAAMYPLFDLPHLESENVFTIFDIPEKQRNKILFKEGTTPVGVNLEDISDGEILLNDDMIGITKGGSSMMPLETQAGLVFINAKYLSPVSDIDGTMELYERMSADGRQYIVIKYGMLIYGAIMPMDIIDKKFVDQMRSLYNQCEVALGNKKAAEDQKNQQIKISRFELDTDEEKEVDAE